MAKQTVIDLTIDDSSSDQCTGGVDKLSGFEFYSTQVLLQDRYSKIELADLSDADGGEMDELGCTYESGPSHKKKAIVYQIQRLTALPQLI